MWFGDCVRVGGGCVLGFWCNSLVKSGLCFVVSMLY